MQLLLVHVMEMENRNPTEDCYNDGFGSARAANFRRFSPPISMNVSPDFIQDELRLVTSGYFKRKITQRRAPRKAEG